MDKTVHHHEKKKIRPHAFLIPLPLQGHINPMFKVAKLLHGRGFYITFVNTEFSHRRLLSSQRGDPDEIHGQLPAGFKFAVIPSTDFDIIESRNHEKMVRDIRTKFSAPVNALVKEINKSEYEDGGHCFPPISCMVSDPMMIFSIEVAKEFGIPLFLFFVFSASSVLTFPRIPKLVQNGVLPLKDKKGYLDSIVEGMIAGINGTMRLKDLPTFFRLTESNFAPYHYFMELFEKSRDKNLVTGVILNTCEELEPRSVQELSSIFPKLFTIGPLHRLADEIPNDNDHHHQLDSFEPNLLREDVSCLLWLDSRPPNSVLLVSFGTTGFLKPEQVEEFAWGLADSQESFLWIIRSELIIGGSKVTWLRKFESGIKDRGLIIRWSPQQKVLLHPAIGGCLTHCGWNSVLESVSAGVPLLCWPNYADQPVNSWLSCNQWGNGMEIGSNGVIKREEIELLARELISGQKGKVMKQKALQLKKKVEEACRPTGSSFRNLEKMVELLLSIDSRKAVNQPKIFTDPNPTPERENSDFTFLYLESKNRRLNIN